MGAEVVPRLEGSDEVDDRGVGASFADLHSGEWLFLDPEVPQCGLCVPPRVQGNVAVTEQGTQSVLVRADVFGMLSGVLQKALGAPLVSHQIEIHEQHTAVDVLTRVLDAERRTGPVTHEAVQRIGDCREVGVAELHLQEGGRRFEDDRVGVEVQNLVHVRQEVWKEHSQPDRPGEATGGVLLETGAGHAEKSNRPSGCVDRLLHPGAAVDAQVLVVQQHDLDGVAARGDRQRTQHRRRRCEEALGRGTCHQHGQSLARCS